MMLETIVVGFDRPHAVEIRKIRNDVFTQEQGIDEALDFDGQDADAVHVLVACDGQYVGTGRMLSDGHIGRLAVLKEYRGRGLGAQAVLALVREAQRSGLERVYLGSQEHAVGFYRKLGFSAYGEPYTEAGIAHIHMERPVSQGISERQCPVFAYQEDKVVTGVRGNIEPLMVYIPAGSFLMGTSDQQAERLSWNSDLARKWKDRGYFAREQPQHVVTLRGYFIGRFPVTVGEFRAFVEADGYRNRRWWTEAGWRWRTAVGRERPEHWEDAKWAGDDRLPVVGVSWYEGYAYCQWLSAAARSKYRLPTEAEWEKAARGTEGRLYPWGDEFEARRCNTRTSEVGRTVPVGQYRSEGASPYGCEEMAGNVSEWTVSQFRPYPYRSDDGRNEEEGEAVRVTRGGSWHQPALRARTACRGMNDPFFADKDVGFRYLREE